MGINPVSAAKAGISINSAAFYKMHPNLAPKVEPLLSSGRICTMEKADSGIDEFIRANTNKTASSKISEGIRNIKDKIWNTPKARPRL